VKRDVDLLLQEWKELRLGETDEHVSLELKRLDTALNAIFERVQDGNLEAVDRLLRIMERRAKYLGLDAPTRFNAKFDDLRRLVEGAGIDMASLIKAMMAEIQSGGVTIVGLRD